MAVTVDRSPIKRGRFLPGTHILVYAPWRLDEAKPDYVLILRWDRRSEIASQLGDTRDWGARLVVRLPQLEVF